MDGIVKWGILGLGDIAHQFASVFESKEAKLVAVGSRTIEKATEFAEKYSIEKVFGSYQELCDDPTIDVVYLATPNNYHTENMKMVLNAGKHVFCEKAITPNKKELDEVLSLAKEKGLIVAEAMTIFHMPLYKELKKRIKSGEFGDLKLVNAMFGSLKEADPTNRFFSKELGGGALLDIGVYALSFVQYFLETAPEKIQTNISFYETGVDETSTIQYQTEDHILGNVSLAFRGKMPKQGVIVCEKAYITVYDYPRAIDAIITYPDGETETLQIGDREKALVYEIENFSETVRTQNDLSELETTRYVNQIIDQVSEDWGMNLSKFS